MGAMCQAFPRGGAVHTTAYRCRRRLMPTASNAVGILTATDR